MVQSRACPKPLELITGHGVLGWDLEGLAVALGDLDGDGCPGIAVEQARETAGLYDIASTDTRVIGLVGEPKRKDALFLCHVMSREHQMMLEMPNLEVRLVDPSE